LTGGSIIDEKSLDLMTEEELKKTLRQVKREYLALKNSQT